MLMYINLQRVNWHRWAIQVFLVTVTTESRQQITLSLSFDAFSHYVQPQALRQPNNRARNCSIVGVGQYVLTLLSGKFHWKITQT